MATTVKVQWLWDGDLPDAGGYIDAPVLRWRDTGGDPDLDETLYFCNDANMNVTALVSASGAVVERYVYDPYGKVTILDGTTGGQTEWAADADQKSDVANEILYCGYRYDTETGLCHVRHRMYHPALGRWLQRDPIGYVDGMGLYEYVGSSPAVARDPAGLVRREFPSGEPGARDAIADIAPEGALYADAFGLGEAQARLSKGADHVSDFIPFSPAALLGAAAAYHTSFNFLWLPEGAEFHSIIHELIHAYDDSQDLYMSWYISPAEEEAMEALAYAGQHLLDRARYFGDFEQQLNTVGGTDGFPCSAIRVRWNGLWADMMGVTNQETDWGPPFWRSRRKLTNADIEDAFRVLGFRISCCAYEARLNARMEALRIPDDESPGQCCRVKCPESLRGTPFE